LAVLTITAVDDISLVGDSIGAQLPKLLLVLTEVFAHAFAAQSREHHVRLSHPLPLEAR
jgi:hypothetical protein